MATAMESAMDGSISKVDRDRLHDAVESGDDVTVKQILDKFPEIVVTLSDTFFCFYLHLACMNNQAKICEQLLSNGANVKQPDDQGDTPLHVALGSQADVEIIQMLLTNGASVTKQNQKRKTPFHLACESGSFEYIESLLKYTTEPLDQKDLYGQNGLHLLARKWEEFENSKSLKASIELILKSGLDINDRDQEGSTVLHHAAFRFGFDLILDLIDLGADPFICDCYGNSFMLTLEGKLTAEELDKSITRLIEKLKTRQFCDSHLCKSLVLRPVENFINLKNMSGKSIFHLFLYQASLCTLEYIISNGADVNLQDNTGQSPLHICARMEGEQAKISLLLQYDANVHLRDIHGRTPLFEVIDFETAEILLAHGADPNAEDKLGMNPLHVAAIDHRPEVIKTLISSGALVNSKDKHGSTALHYASWFSFNHVIDVLREHGADPAIMDNNTKTAPQLHTIDHESQTYSIAGVSERDMSQPEVVYAKKPQWDVKAGKNTGSCNNMSATEFSTKLLSTPKLGLLSNVGETLYIKQVIIELLTKMMHHVSSIDARFRGRLFATGSSTEGTRVGEPNEFDFLYFLEEFEEECDIDEVYYYLLEGFVHLKAKDLSSACSQYFDDSGILDGETVRDRLKQLLKISIEQSQMWDTNELFHVDFTDDALKPVLNLEVRYIGSFFKSLDISVDIVPAIYKKSWWPSNNTPETLKLMTEDIKDAGCAILLQNPGIEFMPDDNKANFMRISCAPAEIALLRLFPAYAKKSYALVKVFLSGDVSPGVDSIGFEGEMTKLPAGYYISSYMIKNCLFHEMAQMDERFLISLLSGKKMMMSDQEMAFSADDGTKILSCKELVSDVESLYARNNTDISDVIDLTKKILLRLQDYVKQGTLPAYFMPTVNVLGYEYRAIYGEEYDEVEESVHQKESARIQIISYLLDFLGKS